MLRLPSFAQVACLGEVPERYLVLVETQKGLPAQVVRLCALGSVNEHGGERAHGVFKLVEANHAECDVDVALEKGLV